MTLNAPVALTLRALARLLSYPDAALRAHLAELGLALQREAALRPARRAELDALIASIAGQPPLATEADYVQLFDSGRRTSLYLFEHVHGDSRDRGPAMVDLARTFEAAGLYLAEGEMPDHLPVVLEYASTQPPAAARAFLGEMVHILNAIFSALERRGSRYASALGALVELAGGRAEAVRLPDEPAVDETWREPAAFDGCRTEGQGRPGQPQPVRIVRRPTASQHPGGQP